MYMDYYPLFQTYTHALPEHSSSRTPKLSASVMLESDTRPAAISNDLAPPGCAWHQTVSHVKALPHPSSESGREAILGIGPSDRPRLVSNCCPHRPCRLIADPKGIDAPSPPVPQCPGQEAPPATQENTCRSVPSCTDVNSSNQMCVSCVLVSPNDISRSGC